MSKLGPVVLYNPAGGARHLARVAMESAGKGKSFCGWWMETDAEMMRRCLEEPGDGIAEIARQRGLPLCRRCQASWPMPWIAKTYTVKADELSEQLNRYEQQYGVPSSRLMDAFTHDGELVETPDFRRWSRLFTASSRLTH